MNQTDAPKASLAELLCALSFVSDIGMGQAIGHGLRTAYIGLQVADRLNATLEERQAVYYGALVKDAGCTACAGVFATFFGGDDLAPRSDCLLLKPDSVKDAVAWFWRHAPSDPALPSRIANLFSFLTECQGVMKEGVAAHCEVGEMFARRLGLPESVQTTIRFGWERWDGKGLAYGLKGTNVPRAARILRLSQVIEAAHAFGTEQAANAIATERRGTDFDPDVVDAFLTAGSQPGFWAIVETESFQRQVLDMKPASDFDALSNARIDAVCEILADFADAKSRTTWNHSPRVAETAVVIGKGLGLKASELAGLRRSALVHDLGKAAVSVGILDKGTDLSASEQDRFRLHPYYTERVLTQIEPLRELATAAASHHEYLDGSGYHKQLRGEAIPLAGRILAVADTYTLLRTDSQLGEEKALAQIKSQAGVSLDAACCESLLRTSQGLAPTKRTENPGNLTDREVEVIRLAALGFSNRKIAEDLVISEKTVEHHLEHVFNKLGVTSRTAAVVFAVQNGLAP